MPCSNTAAQKPNYTYSRASTPVPVFANPKFFPMTAYSTEYTINCDWFQCMLTGATFPIFENQSVYEFNNGKITFVKERPHSPHFLNQFRIVIDGRPYGEILCNPKNPEIIKEDTIQFKVENPRLYEVGWLDTFKDIMQVFNWRMLNISRVDIALDGHGFLAVGQKWLNGKIQSLSQADFKPRLNNKLELVSYEFGSRISDRSLICYDKTAELEISNKYYIRDMWKAANLDTSTPVERLEVCLKNEWFKKIDHFSWADLDSFEYLACLMRTALEKFYQFIYPSENARKTRCRKYDFINWNNIGGEFLLKNSAIKSNEVHSFKRASKTMYLIHKRTGLETHLHHSREIPININCLQWWVDKLELWDKDFEYKTGKNRNGEIYYQYLTNFKEYGINQQITVFDHISN